MKQLPKIDHDLSEQLPDTNIYAIAVSPGWKHWHATKCPQPIKDLMDRNYPDVTIERVAGWQGGSVVCDPKSEEMVNPYELPQPIFRLHCSDEQAIAFQQEWSELTQLTGEVGDDFYFLTMYRPQHPACLSNEELEAGIDLNEIDFSCLQDKAR